MKKLIAAALGVALFGTTAAQAERSTLNFTSITVFGDSLVDAGNFFNATGGTQPDPALGYFNGRFTNGYNFPDLLSIDLFGAPTLASTSGGSNFAYGFARATTTSMVPDLTEQFAAYDAYLTGGHSVDANGLYIMTFGANDIFNLPDGYPTASDALMAAAGNIAAGVQALNNMGARNILITDFPIAGSGLAYSLEGNAYLTAALGALTLDSDTTLMRFNVLSFFNQVFTDPASLGMLPVSPVGNCIAAGAQASGCAGFFSFDGTHPTAAVQAGAYRSLKSQFDLFAVPEPSTWAMMIGGFALAGAALRTRRRAVSFA